MVGERKKKRVSKDEWLAVALEVLEESGVESVKIDRLARRVGVAKSGFYWHFRDRQELLDAMLEFWVREYTAVVAKSPGINTMPPAERLLAINEAVLDFDLNRYDLAIAAWARFDENVAEQLRHSTDMRMEIVGKAFRELGFRGDDLEMRTRLFVCYVSNEAIMFGPRSSAKERRIRALRNRLLIQELADA
jgi:AcrR family transcriptional regulator